MSLYSLHKNSYRIGTELRIMLQANFREFYFHALR
jgi:hypothetical protein